MSYRLVSFNTNLLQTLMNWFNNASELAFWAGPNIRYPYTPRTFSEDIKIVQLASYALIDSNDQLIAFGQFYNRLNYCHLGRLVVSPDMRGQGIAKILINGLMNEGQGKLGLGKFSLFVMEENKSAIHLYEKLGFTFKQYPEEISLKHCLYMIRK